MGHSTEMDSGNDGFTLLGMNLNSFLFFSLSLIALLLSVLLDVTLVTRGENGK